MGVHTKRKYNLDSQNRGSTFSLCGDWEKAGKGRDGEPYEKKRKE